MIRIEDEHGPVLMWVVAMTSDHVAARLAEQEQLPEEERDDKLMGNLATRQAQLAAVRLALAREQDRPAGEGLTDEQRAQLMACSGEHLVEVIDDGLRAVSTLERQLRAALAEGRPPNW